MLIDVAISGDRNVIKKEAEKILKYKDLTIEIQRMWNVRTKVIPVNLGSVFDYIPFPSDTSNKRGDWDYFKVIQKISEQHTRRT